MVKVLSRSGASGVWPREVEDAENEHRERQENERCEKPPHIASLAPFCANPS
jgi:hypothetical protein